MTDAAEFHILLVDDDELVLAGLKRLLRPLQLPILQASTAEQAAQHLRAHPVGAIVCEPRDERLAAFLINAMVHHPTTTRVILTGYPDMGSVLKAVNEAHPFKLLTKPWIDDDLCATVQQAMAEHHVNLGRERLLNEYQHLRASTERAHAYRALSAVTQSARHDIGEDAIQALAVGAMMFRNDFLVRINPAAHRILFALGQSVPVAGVRLSELHGLCAELEQAARATPLNSDTSARTSWRSSQGHRLDYFVRQVQHGTLVTFACPP